MKRLKEVLIFFVERIEEIFFPPCCLICGKLGVHIWCNKCKKELLEKAVFKVEKIKQEGRYFQESAYLFFYQDRIRKLILDYKFKDCSYLYLLFAEIIIKNEKICGILKKYDIIIPVPIHKKRKRERGYNQSALIAKEIAKKIENLKYENKVLQKVKHTVPQSSLTKEQRKQNVENVYKMINKETIRNKKVILLDDIYTTGNTVNTISKILKENGAKKILVLTIAKD